SLEAEVGRGESSGGRSCALGPGLLPEPTRLPPGRKRDGFPEGQDPHDQADGGGLGPGGRPSSQVFKEPRRRPDRRASFAPTAAASSGRRQVSLKVSSSSTRL